jgi:hypothetical protein
MHVVIGLNPGSHFFSCSHYVVISHYTKNYCTKVVYFLEIFHHTSVCGPVASGTSVDSSSQVCSSAVLVLATVENCKV